MTTADVLADLLVNVDNDYKLVAYRRIAAAADSFAVVFLRPLPGGANRYYLATIDLDAAVALRDLEGLPGPRVTPSDYLTKRQTAELEADARRLAERRRLAEVNR